MKFLPSFATNVFHAVHGKSNWCGQVALSCLTGESTDKFDTDGEGTITSWNIRDYLDSLGYEYEWKEVHGTHRKIRNFCTWMGRRFQGAAILYSMHPRAWYSGDERQWAESGHISMLNTWNHTGLDNGVLYPGRSAVSVQRYLTNEIVLQYMAITKYPDNHRFNRYRVLPNKKSMCEA